MEAYCLKCIKLFLEIKLVFQNFSTQESLLEIPYTAFIIFLQGQTSKKRMSVLCKDINFGRNTEISFSDYPFCLLSDFNSFKCLVFKKMNEIISDDF